MLGRRALCVLLMFLVLETSLSGMAEAHSLGKAGKASHKSHVEKLTKITNHLVTRMRAKHHRRHLEENKDEEDKKEEAKDDEDDPEKAMMAKLPESKEGKSLKSFFSRLHEMGDEDEKENKENMVKFIILVVVVILVFGVVAYNVQKTNEPNLNMNQFLMGNMTALSIGVGMMSGLVFGIIDNAGLFFGMEYLDPVLSGLPNGHEPLVLAGYGNTFSDMIGAFLGTFGGKIIEEMAKKQDPNLGDYPIWTEAVGITLGCLIGVTVPRMILGDPDKKLLAESINKAKELGIDQSEVDELIKVFDELDAGADKDKPGMVRSINLQMQTRPGLDDIIREADNDGNGWVTKGEVVYSLVRDRIKRNRKAMRELVQKHSSK